MSKRKKKLTTMVLAGTLLITIAMMGSVLASAQSEDIGVREVYDLIIKNKENSNFVIIDVRTPQEYTDGHIENALNLDYYSENFRDELNELNKERIYLIYCASGNRSSRASSIMEELTFREVYNMLGGITQWKAEGYPVQ